MKQKMNPHYDAKSQLGDQIKVIWIGSVNRVQKCVSFFFLFTSSLIEVTSSLQSPRRRSLFKLTPVGCREATTVKSRCSRRFVPH